MNALPSHSFSAQILQRGAAGFAGMTAAALLEREPRLRERFGPDALESWKHHLTQRILELAAALGAAEPGLFVSRVTWTGKAFRARQQGEADVRVSMQVLRDVLGERLPEAGRAAALDYLDRALAALDAPAPAADAAGLDPSRPADALALRYLQKVLEGDVGAAVEEVVNATRKGMDVRSAYLDVLLPAQREIGRLWHLGEVSVAEEHLVTSTTQRAMAVLSHAAPAAAPNGRCAVVAGVASNAHDIGLRAVADFYQSAGWRTIFLGANVPAADLPAVLAYFSADLLLLGATITTQLSQVAETIAAIRAGDERGVKIVVGGALFDGNDALWKKVGADGYAGRVDEAVAVGTKLVGD